MAFESVAHDDHLPVGDSSELVAKYPLYIATFLAFVFIGQSNLILFGWICVHYWDDIVK